MRREPIPHKGRLTKLEAIRVSKNLWKYLADTGRFHKPDSFWLKYAHACPMCEYHTQKCWQCVLGSEELCDFGDGDAYKRWSNGTKSTRKDCAQIIYEALNKEYRRLVRLKKKKEKLKK